MCFTTIQQVDAEIAATRALIGNIPRSAEEMGVTEKFTFHMADQATCQEGMNGSVMTMEQQQRKLYRLLEIRGLMTSGQYGICVDCHQKIDKIRMEAVSTAKRCTPCQNAHENSGHSRS